jgi:FixJ family two-component response regulator
VRAPFVVLTGNLTPQMAVTALDCGARYVLPKPLDEVRLLDRLGKILIG